MENDRTTQPLVICKMYETATSNNLTHGYSEMLEITCE